MNIMRQGVSQKLKNNRCKHANTIFLCSPVLKIDYYIWKYLEATMALGFLKSFRALQQVAFLVHGTSFLRIIVVSVFFHGTALINVFLKDENIMCIELLRGVFSSLLQFPCNWANCRVVMVEYIRTKSGEFPISALYDIMIYDRIWFRVQLLHWECLLCSFWQRKKGSLWNLCWD